MNIILPSAACVGIDEVGRGCLAGPVLAGAVSLQADFYQTSCFIKLNDSKWLRPSMRGALACALHDLSRQSEALLAYGLGEASVTEIDLWGIQKATWVAMRRALACMALKHRLVLLDGRFGLPKICAYPVVRGDSFIPAIQAASVLAKVARDAWMVHLDAFYPGYGFSRHKGYGTQEHLRALGQLGVTDLHRKKFKPVRHYERAFRSVH